MKKFNRMTEKQMSDVNGGFFDLLVIAISTLLFLIPAAVGAGVSQAKGK